MDIHGIVASEHPYGHNDMSHLVVEGADISRLEGSYVYHDVNSPLDGVITAAKRVLTLQDCDSDSDRGLWDLAGGKPFVRVSARLVRYQDMFSQHIAANPGLTTWFAMGAILERDGEFYTRTVLKDVLLDLLPRHLAPSPYRVIKGKG